MLDVRGHMHIEGNSQGDAHIYFPETGDEAGFYIRSADAPKVNDREKTRFYLSVDGKVGINTVTPEFGLELEAKTGVKTGGDIMIKKGNLHVYDGIRHTDKKHMLLMDSDNVFNGLHMEESLMGVMENMETSSWKSYQRACLKLVSPLLIWKRI